VGRLGLEPRTNGLKILGQEAPVAIFRAALLLGPTKRDAAPAGQSEGNQPAVDVAEATLADALRRAADAGAFDAVAALTQRSLGWLASRCSGLLIRRHSSHFDGKTAAFKRPSNQAAPRATTA